MCISGVIGLRDSDPSESMNRAARESAAEWVFLVNADVRLCSSLG